MVPDFTETQSIIIWKSHHVIGDGIGTLLFLSTLQDEYSPDQWIQTSSIPSFFMKVMLILTKPLTLTYAFLCFFFWSTDNNVLKQGKPLNGYKKASILKPMDVATLKKIGKFHNQATINDVVLGLVSVSMKEYMKSLGD